MMAKSSRLLELRHNLVQAAHRSDLRMTEFLTRMPSNRPCAARQSRQTRFMTHSLWSKTRQARDLLAWMCGSGSGSISKGSDAKRAFHRRSLLTEQTSTRPISAGSNGVSATQRSPYFSALQKHLETNPDHLIKISMSIDKLYNQMRVLVDGKNASKQDFNKIKSRGFFNS